MRPPSPLLHLLFSASFSFFFFVFNTSSSHISFCLSMNPSVDPFMFSLSPLLWLPLLETVRDSTKWGKALTHIGPYYTNHKTHKLPLPSAWRSPWRRRKEMEAVYEAQMQCWPAHSHCKPFQPCCHVPVYTFTYTEQDKYKHKCQMSLLSSKVVKIWNDAIYWDLATKSQKSATK